MDAEASRTPSLQPIVDRASDIETRMLEPIWDGVLWTGKTTILAGDPGLGKSLISLDIAARLTTEREMPFDSDYSPAGNVLFISGEDDPADTIKPRLLAAGADLDRVFFWSGLMETNRNGRERQLAIALDQHVGQLRQLAVKHSIRMVVIDPITAFLGGADSHKNAEVRALLAGLSAVASELRFAVLAVSHLNKGGANISGALARISGSVAFAAAARAAFLVAKDPAESSRRLMLPGKVNLGPDSAGFSYRIEVTAEGHPFIAWSDEREMRQAEEIFTPEHTTRRDAVKAGVDRAAAWLSEYLAGGPKLAQEVQAAAREARHSLRHLTEAKRALRIASTPSDHQGPWEWQLPASPACGSVSI